VGALFTTVSSITVSRINNNNNPICKAPECQKTSVALKDFRVRGVRVILTVMVRVSRVSIMVSVRDGVK